MTITLLFNPFQSNPKSCIMKTLTTLVTLFLFTVTLSAQEKNDTVGTDLQEIIIKADQQKITAQTATYFPTSKVKRAANNAVDLLLRMAIPQIAIDPVTKEVTTPLKENVEIFINFLKATQSDIEGLQTADVKAVEYIDYPSDPRFQGAQHAINIIVHKYEYGGYTKLSDRQEVISKFNNAGSVYSKFVYKKMTYDIYAGADFSNTSHFGGDSESWFHLADGVVGRTEKMKSGRQKTWNLPISFRATYLTDKVRIANAIGFTFNNKSKNRSEGELSLINDNIGSGYCYSTDAPSVNRALSWSGGYFIVLPRNWSLYLEPGFVYAHNNSISLYSTDVPGAEPIINNAREDAYRIPWNANATKKIKDGHYLELYLTGNTSINHIDYYGSSPCRSNFSNTNVSGLAAYTFYPGNKFFMKLLAGAGGYVSKVNGIKQSEWTPNANITLSYAPTRKSQYQLNLITSRNAVGSNMRSSNIIQSNEFLFKTGNPEIKTYQSLNIQGTYTFLPLNQLNFQAYARYFGAYNRPVGTYEPYDNGKFIISSMKNSGDYNSITAGANVTARLADNSLVVQLSPSFSHMTSSGYYKMSHNYFDFSVNAQYYIGNFNINALWASKSYSMGMLTGSHTRTPAFYYVEAGWSKYSWYFSLSAKNFLRSNYYAQHETLSTPSYTTSDSYQVPSYHAALVLSATYTFGYGKKVDRGRELNALGGAESAIMR